MTEQQRHARLIELEQVVATAVAQFHGAIGALIEIRSEKLFLATHESFGAFARDSGLDDLERILTLVIAAMKEPDE